MEGLRLLTNVGASPLDPCCRCQAAGCPWDRIAGKPMCPDCQEALALGEGPPLMERVAHRPCAICRQVGALSYLTYPLHTTEPLEIDLCGDHFQALLARRLDRHSFKRLSGQLHTVGVSVRQIFLLHEAFYDLQGQSLQPIPEPW